MRIWHCAWRTSCSSLCCSSSGTGGRTTPTLAPGASARPSHCWGYPWSVSRWHWEGETAERRHQMSKRATSHLWAIGYDDMERAGQVKEEVTKLGWDQAFLILSDV